MRKYIIATMIIMICCSIGIKVKADTITSWTTQQARVQTTHDGTDTWTSWTNITGDNATIFSNLTNPVKAIAWRVKTNNGMSNLNVYSFRFSYKPTPDAIHPSSYYMQNDTTGEEEEITCTITRNESSGYYWYDCSFQPQTSYTSTDYLYIKINFTLSYLTEMRMSIRGYDERKGTNAVITEQTNNIITNNEQNTQEIINSLTEANETLVETIIDSSNICVELNNDVWQQNKAITASNGSIIDANGYYITNYTSVDTNSKLYLKQKNNNAYYALCFYNSNKQYISCLRQIDLSLGLQTIPQNAKYLIATIDMTSNTPKWQLCKNGNQALIDENHEYENIVDISTEVEQEQQLEQNINNNLDTQFLDDLNITLGTEPSNYVWNKMTMIYNLNSKWQIFIYTVLGLGIIKLILGR